MSSKKRAGMTTNALLKALGGSPTAKRNLSLLMGASETDNEKRLAKVRKRKKERAKERKLLPYHEFMQLKGYGQVPALPEGEHLGSNGIWIPFDVPSFKNSKEIQGNRLTHSAAVKDYIKLSEPCWQREKFAFERMAQRCKGVLLVQFTFIRGTKGKFDYINMAQGPLDLMQEYGWLSDDDAATVKPSFGDYRVADKHHAGVIIRLLNV
jgi:hypothetical protein